MPKFPDPVMLVVQWLNPLLPDTRVAAEVPNGWGYSSPLVEVVDSGGPGVQNAVLDQRRISFEVTAPTRPEASALVQRVRDLLLWESPPLSTSWFWDTDTAAPTRVTFPDDKATARYIYTVRIKVRATF